MHIVPIMALELQERLLHVEEYQRMVEVGILTEDDRVELLAGRMIQMSPIGIRHVNCVNALTSLFAPFYDEVIISVQNPLQLDQLSLPEPDLAILKKDERKTPIALPNAEEVLLVVEVADSSLGKDSQIKQELYAKAAVPEYWIVDLVNDLILIFRKPQDGAYQISHQFSAGDSFSFPALGGTVEVNAILP